ncbi:MAG: GNAT family N-acetyltransferase [Thermoplasmata archaeon]
MKIRSPRPDDNEELIELDRISPEEGLVSYYVDRRPVYIRQPDEEGFFPYVAVEDGKIAGVVFSSVDDLNVNGELHKCVYISSLRVHPAYRRRGIGGALINQVIEEAKKEKAEIFWAVVIGKNRASFKTFQKCGFSRVGGYGFRVLRMRRRKESSGALLREAREDDLDRMTKVISSFYNGHNFRPEVTRDWLASRFRRKKSLSSFHIAERGGRIVATLRAVRQWHITRMMITKLSWKVRLANLLLRTGIRGGSLLKMLDLTDFSYVPGEEGSALDLISFVNWKHRRDCRIAFFQYGLEGEEERLMALTRGIPGYSDVMALSPNLSLGKLDPIFPAR